MNTMLHSIVPQEKTTEHDFPKDDDYMVNGIQFINFRILSEDDIIRHSVVKVSDVRLYTASTSNPTPGGLLDRRLGVGAKGITCETCHKDWTNCVGHFGHIELCYPVYHVGFFNQIIEILHSICKTCARVLLNDDQRLRFRARIHDDLNPLSKKAIHKEILAQCKKVKTCAHCENPNGKIKKFAFMKIFHLNEHADDTLVYGRIFENSSTSIEEVKNYFGKSCEFLSPYAVLKLFERIPKPDYIFLMLFESTPMDLIVTRVPVPPCIIRPSVRSAGTQNSTEDHLTAKLNDVLLVNDSMMKRMQDGFLVPNIMDSWDFLQVLVSVYINSDVRNLPPQHSTVAAKGLGIAQRLKGKEGRFRANLSGKRVNFSARTVISPDPNMGIDEVGIPMKIALNMTYPVRVTPFNIEFCRQLVLNGPKNHPGAIFVFSKKRKVHLSFTDRKRFAQNLQYGDTVLRHMMNGDYVLFNRQPSLHRLSIMCHKVRIHPDQTFKFNECVCSPYNADFDGDEMNVHFMQAEEAKAEAATLMQSKQNMTSPRNGEPVIAPIQDFITSIYLMTKRDTFYNKFEVCQIISNFLLAKVTSDHVIQVPKPAIVKPIELWTGKQLFSMILKPYVSSKVQLNLIFKTKAYVSDQDLCSNEGYVVIRNSQLLCGRMDKSLIGGGSKKNLFYLILKEYGSTEAIETMLRLCRVSSFYITNYGFSIGIDDVTPTSELVEEKMALVAKGYSTVDGYIEQYWKGVLNPITGLTREQTLESLILKELSEIREHAGKACIRQLSHKNSPLVMANCGSKGSYINVSQMAVCVGQQSIRGQRVTDGFQKRVLPHFDVGDKSPMAKGFVQHSFFEGLNPFEFFFHAMAGREGLLDTAVKTAETGYMQRRLIKGLEDLVVHYDYSVRNSDGEVVQFEYGDDCIDPINIESDDFIIDLDYYWNHVLATTNIANNEDRIQSGEEARRLVQLHVDQLDMSSFYKNKVLAFFEKIYLEIDGITSKWAHDRAILRKLMIVSAVHIKHFLENVERKCILSKIDPGTAIGAICAQSIGEPTTQMTLKTFHFAGVASMNITQGVPRITEIINATKNPSTPFIQAELIQPDDVKLAEEVKLLIEIIYLDQICEKIYQTILQGELCFILKLNTSVYHQLALTEDSLEKDIRAQLKPESVEVGKVATRPYVKIIPTVKRMVYLSRVFEDELAKVVVSGNRHVKRVTIREDNGKYYLMIEGNGFRDVLGTKAVDWKKTRSNNIHEVAAVLGIEAARRTIIEEIKSTMAGHGITIDERHLMLLADTMTASGHVVGMTRSGFSKVKSSTIKMASFERTVDNLYSASYYSNKDDLLGASECIIVGAPTKMGTGFFDVHSKFRSTQTQPMEFKRYEASLRFDGVDY